MATIVGVRFRNAGKLYYFSPGQLWPTAGDAVIVETVRGVEYGEVVTGVREVADAEVVQPLKPIIRIATVEDERHQRDNQRREREAYDICLRKIADHKLEMKLVSVEYTFDNSKILFYFTANGRVDFRALVKDLASVFKTRIELKQIGVRDEAKMMGGLGLCGRPVCCAQFMGDFQPVSIKMAKSQNLSLNPTKISGTCGRLMCCLKYEQDTYEALIRTSPKIESFVDTPEGRGTVIEADILRQRVKVRMESSPDTVSTFANEEVAVLRSGRAKKNDPPIPADLAPISGNGIRPKAAAKQEDDMVLEPIRFRYSTESLVEETPAEPEQETAERPAPKPRRNDRRRQRAPPGRGREKVGGRKADRGWEERGAPAGGCRGARPAAQRRGKTPPAPEAQTPEGCQWSTGRPEGERHSSEKHPRRGQGEHARRAKTPPPR